MRNNAPDLLAQIIAQAGEVERRISALAWHHFGDVDYAAGMEHAKAP